MVCGRDETVPDGGYQQRKWNTSVISRLAHFLFSCKHSTRRSERRANRSDRGRKPTRANELCVEWEILSFSSPFCLIFQSRFLQSCVALRCVCAGLRNSKEEGLRLEGEILEVGGQISKKNPSYPQARYWQVFEVTRTG